VARGSVINGRYRLVQRIGSGATGEVYEAVDDVANRPVAVKLLYPHYAREPGNRSRFERELEVVRRLSHPQIVEVHDTGWDAGRETLFIVMELLRGRTLGDLFTRDPPSPRRDLFGVVLEALGGLAAAHAQGVIHRDIKPENVFIDARTEPSRVRWIDFGLAKHIEGDHLTLTEYALGTPTHMAPEQATKARDVTFAADVWSVGVLMYRIAAGFAPFEGDGPYEVLLKSTTSPPPPLVGVPPPVARLIGACLEKEATRRPPDAEVLRSRLEAVLRDPSLAGWLDEPSTSATALELEHTLTSPESAGAPSASTEPRTAPSAPAPAEQSEEAKAAARRAPDPSPARARRAALAVGGVGLALGLVSVLWMARPNDRAAVRLVAPPPRSEPRFETSFEASSGVADPRPPQRPAVDAPAAPKAEAISPPSARRRRAPEPATVEPSPSEPAGASGPPAREASKTRAASPAGPPAAEPDVAAGAPSAPPAPPTEGSDEDDGSASGAPGPTGGTPSESPSDSDEGGASRGEGAGEGEKGPESDDGDTQIQPEDLITF